VRRRWQNAGVIKGIHHLGFTVRDAEASAAWYMEVPGFRRAGEHQAPDGAFRKVFLRHGNLPARIGLTEHRAGRKDMLDETRTGLDHLSSGVTDRAEPDAWVTRPEAARAGYSQITTANSIPGAAVVVFRDPGSIQLEIFFDPAWAEPA
jgi:catechol 2,3-dioxygenase-like lactoylglutathione lyase family enzyme